MLRTQIYLTREERAGLGRVARATGKRQSELIRDAIDRFLDTSAIRRRDEVLREAAGLWKGRTDLPGLDLGRRSWDRG